MDPVRHWCRPGRRRGGSSAPRLAEVAGARRAQLTRHLCARQADLRHAARQRRAPPPRLRGRSWGPIRGHDDVLRPRLGHRRTPRRASPPCGPGRAPRRRAGRVVPRALRRADGARARWRRGSRGLRATALPTDCLRAARRPSGAPPCSSERTGRAAGRARGERRRDPLRRGQRSPVAPRDLGRERPDPPCARPRRRPAAARQPQVLDEVRFAPTEPRTFLEVYLP